VEAMIGFKGSFLKGLGAMFAATLLAFFFAVVPVANCGEAPVWYDITGNINGSPVVGNTSGSVTSYLGSNCSGADAPQSLYSFTLGSSATVSITTCGGASWDTQLILWDSFNASITCNDNSSCGDQSTILIGLAAGTYHLIMTGNGSSGSYSGSYSLYISTVSPTPTPTPGCSNMSVLIIHGNDHSTDFQNQISAEPGVTAVDIFDAYNGTPSLAQLQRYNIVVVTDEYGFSAPASLGDNLADYVDGGGVVVPLLWVWSPSYDILGRWSSGNYSPFTENYNFSLPSGSLGSYSVGHPLMQGVSILNADYRTSTSLSSGAVQVAEWQDGLPLIAYKGRVVGINAFVGNSFMWDGQFGKVVVNAGRWLAICGATPTPTVLMSTLGKPVLAPVPATRGERVCMFYTKAPTSSEMEIYNANGEKLSKVSIEEANNHCWNTTNAAPGVYFVKIVVKYQDGKSETIWRKAVVIP
jgi:hypothetical protein